MSLESSQKVEEIELRQYTNTAFEGKCNFRVSPFYQVVQKHKLSDDHSKVSFDRLLYR